MLSTVAADTWTVLAGQFGFAVLLCGSCVSDWRERRIPNALTVLGLVAALVFHAFAPDGAGLFDTYRPGGLGLRESLLGALAALTLSALLYARGLVGAGDTKLMAAVGGFVGLAALPALLLAVMLAAGLLALIYALLDRDLVPTIGRVFGWLRWPIGVIGIAAGTGDSLRTRPAPRLPLALAIAGGCVAFALAVRWDLLA